MAYIDDTNLEGQPGEQGYGNLQDLPIVQAARLLTTKLMRDGFKLKLVKSKRIRFRDYTDKVRYLGVLLNSNST